MKGFITIITLLFFASQIWAQGNINVVRDQRVDMMVSQHIEHNRANDEVQGYRIQIISRSSRDEVNPVRANFVASYPSVRTYMDYQQPYFKFRVGDFTTRFEAFKFFSKIKQSFPEAYIIRAKIDLKYVD